MAEVSNIEWTDSTFNPWEGCQKVGPGCDHCYAENRNARFGGGVAVNWGPGAPRRRTSAANWRKPVQWEREHAEFFAEHGRRRRVFCASLADVFDNEVDPQWRVDLFLLMIATPNLEWLLLTKRIGNVARMVREQNLAWPRNAALGFTVVNQEELNRDWRKAASAAMAVQPLHLFVSIEPMLGPMRLDRVDTSSAFDEWTYRDNALTGFQAAKCGGYDGPRLDWVIGGFESSARARPGNPAWARSLRDQCEAAGTAFLWKQNGEWAPGSLFADRIPSGEYCDFDGELKTDDERVWKVGKKAAGRLLDGRTHDGFPEVAR